MASCEVEACAEDDVLAADEDEASDEVEAAEVEDEASGEDEAQAARTSASTAATKLVRMNSGFLLMSHTPTLLASHRTLNVPRYQQLIHAA